MTIILPATTDREERLYWLGTAINVMTIWPPGNKHCHALYALEIEEEIHRIMGAEDGSKKESIVIPAKHKNYLCRDDSEGLI